MSLVALFAALTGIGAFIRIPIPYVPLSLQNLMVMFAGLILGGRLAALSQLVYILVGLLGIPIFVHGGGLGYVLQPSFGYLLGFIPGAYVIGRLIENREPLSRPFLLAALLAGTMVIYLLGVPVLYLNLNLIQQKAFSLTTAMWAGFLIFLPGDLIKIGVVLYFGPLLRQKIQMSSPEIS
jgi:biotin transport system substrate-specific component